MDVENIVLLFIRRKTASDDLKGLIEINGKQKTRIELILTEIDKVTLSKWTEVQITKYSKQLLEEVTELGVLTTMFKVNLHENYRHLIGAQNITWEKFTKVLVLTESIMNLVIQNKSENIRRLLIFGITDICVGFLNRNNIVGFFENQGFEHLNESESDCDSEILGGFENLNSNTTTPELALGIGF